MKSFILIAPFVVLTAACASNSLNQAPAGGARNISRVPQAVTPPASDSNNQGNGMSGFVFVPDWFNGHAAISFDCADALNSARPQKFRMVLSADRSTLISPDQPGTWVKTGKFVTFVAENPKMRYDANGKIGDQGVLSESIFFGFEKTMPKAMFVSSYLIGEDPANVQQDGPSEGPVYKCEIP